jgi:hypothetical protein
MELIKFIQFPLERDKDGRGTLVPAAFLYCAQEKQV